MDTSKGIAVADLGEGGGATPWPPPYFKANLRTAKRGKNIFEASPLLILGTELAWPPLTSRSESATES